MRQEKQLLLEEIKGQIEQYDSFVIIRYLKLSSNLANEFRRDVAKAGGNVEMARKRVLMKAAQSAGINLEAITLDGHIGLVFAGKDPLETAKMVIKFSQDNDKVVEVIGGRIDKQLYNAQEVDTLSKLPSMNEMRSQFLSVLEAPLSQTLAVMDAAISSVVYCLDNKIKQDEAPN